MPSAEPRLIITCEHGGNRIPVGLRPLFAGRERLLDSHRGWDPGALALARELSRAFGAVLIAADISRLVIDLNRSPDNPELFSPVTRGVPSATRSGLITTFYWPYRREVEAFMRAAARSAPVIHLSSHSFTPILRGTRRNLDIGLLFDPSRNFEAAVCRAWRTALRARRPRLRVAFNQPYKGTDDGLTTSLRSKFADAEYAGIEVEVNQRFPRRTGSAWERLRADLITTLRVALACH